MIFIWIFAATCFWFGCSYFLDSAFAVLCRTNEFGGRVSEKTEQPMWDSAGFEFTAFYGADLHALESGHPIRRSFPPTVWALLGSLSRRPTPTLSVVLRGSDAEIAQSPRGLQMLF
jgi:hypothetical protein